MICKIVSATVGSGFVPGKDNGMKTDVYRFERAVSDIGEITALAGKAAAYCGLDNKQAMRLELLCEELVEMLPNLLLYGAGELWIENKGKNIEIHAAVQADDLLSGKDRSEILAVSKSGRNAAAVGIVNRIRIAAETMLANYALSVGTGGDITCEASYGMDGPQDPIGYSGEWSLVNYKKATAPESDEWDELEKSIIANLADDVTVGILKGRVEIVVKKSF